MGLYLNRELQNFIMYMINNDCLENLIIHSEETNGKSLLAKYIADLYYRNVQVNNKNELYYYGSLSILGLKKMSEEINNYMKLKFIIQDNKKYKKIIIIDDYYFNDKFTSDYLTRLVCCYNLINRDQIKKYSENIIFIIISKNLSNISELIQSRSLNIYLKSIDSAFFNNIIKSKFKDINNDVIENLKIYTNNSIYVIMKLLETIIKYKDEDLDINKEIKKLYDFKEDKNNDVYSYDKLIKLTLDKKINVVIKTLKNYYDLGYYGEDILNSSLNCILNNNGLEDNKKIIFIEEITKTMYKIYKYSDSILQVIKCFIKIYEKLNLV